MRPRNYGWKRDTFDARDMYFAIPPPTTLPRIVDLRPLFQAIPVEDQGSVGSCTANALCGAFERLHYVAQQRHIDFSRLFLYYCERAREGTTNEDAGAMIRTGIKCLAANGCCPENIWPYKVGNVFTPPSKAALDAATPNKAIAYRRIRGLNGLKTALASGHPVTFGFQVYASSESPGVSLSGIIPVPVRRGWFSRDRLLGGHAVLAVGYNDETNHIIFRNSWGSGWGADGYGYLPYEFITHDELSDDYWVITKATFAEAI